MTKKLSKRQEEVLEALSETPQPTLAEVARRLDVTRARVGQIVRRLKDLGAVRSHQPEPRFEVSP
jgi:DNA-binding MarR family transcriptional regulator